MTRATHEIAIADWVESILLPLGFDPTIFEDEGNIHAVPPYATVRVLSDVAEGPLEIRTLEVDANTARHRTIDRRSGTVTVSVIGGDYYQSALALERSYRKQATIDLNESNGIVMRGSTGGITIVGAESGGAVNNRAVIDFQFAYSNEDTIDDDEFVKAATAAGSYS